MHNNETAKETLTTGYDKSSFVTHDDANLHCDEKGIHSKRVKFINILGNGQMHSNTKALWYTCSIIGECRTKLHLKKRV